MPAVVELSGCQEAEKQTKKKQKNPLKRAVNQKWSRGYWSETKSASYFTSSGPSPAEPTLI